VPLTVPKSISADPKHPVLEQSGIPNTRSVSRIPESADREGQSAISQTDRAGDGAFACIGETKSRTGRSVGRWRTVSLSPPQPDTEVWNMEDVAEAPTVSEPLTDEQIAKLFGEEWVPQWPPEDVEVSHIRPTGDYF
jgi:hypothetical protein